MGKITHTFICISLVLLAGTMKSQLSGTYSIPGSYSSIAAAISDLNTYGVSGPVTFNIASGYTETVISGGYTLNAIAGASSTSPVIFQKSGSGANPLLTAYTGGVGTPTSAVHDGIWRFIGTDYVTINGIDLQDPNTANPATMEFGYCFFKASATDGCQNNTIMNCVITLNRINNVAGIGTAVDGSRGIEVVNATTLSHTTAINVISASGSNSYNKFYSNTIQNCNYGIALTGYADVSPFTFADYNNIIGGSSTTGNNIINYGGGGTTSPAAGVRTLAQYNITVSYNVINNNNGAGICHATVLRGIYLNTATSANATITNNTLTIGNGGTTSQISVIENASGSTAANNTINISNNLIAACTNTANTSGVFYGIYNSASAQNLVMSGNTFSNNTSNATTGSTYLMYNSGVVPGSITISNNSLSHAFNNSGTAYSGSIYNIYNGSGATTSNLTISGNNFSNYNFVNVTGSGSIYFIYNSASCLTTSISANTWSALSLNHSGSEYLMYNSTSTQSLLTVTNNSILASYTRLGASGTMYCYYSGSSSLANSSQVLTGNNFSNITATVSGSGTFYGMYNSDGASPYPRKTIANNVLSNITYSTSGTLYGYYVANFGDGITGSGSQISNNLVTGITTNGAQYGMYITTGTSPNYAPAIYQNTVGSLTSNGASSIVYGTYLASGLPGMNFYKNKIYGLTENGASGSAYGMYISGGTNANYYNNLVGNINTPNSTGASAVNGIYISSGTLLNLYYNSVYLNASSIGSGFGCNALYASTSPSLTLKNNIFVNLSTAMTTGIVAAYRRSSTTVSTYSSASNNNLFYAGTPSATNVIYHDGTTAYQTLGAYKTLMAGADMNAVTENPPFASTTGSLSTYLTINSAFATQIESGGSAVAGITDDYAGVTRNSLPDIGANEGAYLPSTADVTPPLVNAYGFTSSACNTTSRSFTVSLSDVSGVATGSVAPRLYYKVNAGSYTSVAGSLLSGNAYSGVWSFTLSYSVAVNDVISYYLVAQDLVSAPNLMGSPAAGFAGTDVNTISSAPASPFSYQVAGNLSGVYTVGSTGTYSTLTAAANAYNNGCLTGAVTFSLTDALYSTNETYPIVFQNNSGASATNSLLIRPAAGVSVALTPVSTTITSVIKFLNAKYITMDGIGSGGSMLTINNSNASSASANIWLASTAVSGPGCRNITVKSANINGGSSAYSYGIAACVDGNSPSTTAGVDNDYVTVSTNTLLNLYNAVVGVGIGTVSAGALDNWNVSGNVFGPSALGTGTLAGNGIYLAGALNGTIASNTIQYLMTSASGIYAINLNQAVNGFAVTQNTIDNVYSSASSSGVSAVAALYTGPSVVNGTISLNNIYTIVNTSTGGWGVRGIIINTGNAASNINLRNNTLADIYCYADANYVYWPIAIDIENMSGGINMDYNSVSMFGSHTGYSSGVTGSAPLYIGSTAGNLNIRNNIFSNTYDNSTSTTELNYAVYSSVAASNFAIMNYNNYYVGGSGNVPTTGYLTGTTLSSLAAFQAAFGQNANAVAMQPAFTSSVDLHLLASSSQNYLLDNLGTPISGITTDIDGQSRSLSTPDIGADEFTATAVCGTPLSGTIMTAAYTICSTQTLGLIPTGFSAGANTAYQWQVSAVPGGTYTNVSAGTGATTNAYKTPTLSAGIYYYVLKTTCGTTSLTSVSNEVTVTVNGMPNPVIVSSPSVICVSGTATLTASGATSYTWSTGMVSPSIAVTPSSSVIYNVTGSSNGCSNATSANYNLFYSLNPTITAVSASSVVCAGTPATLTAAGAATYSWSNGAAGATANPSPATSTTYVVTGYYANGCNSTASQSIAVNPTPSVTISGASGICSGQSVNLTASGAGSYSWNTGALTNTITDNPSGNTTYTVTGTNSFGCVNTATQLVTVAASLSISIAGPSTICMGQAANLSGNGGVTYTWSTGSTSSTIAPTPTANTTYSIIGASGTCSNTAVRTISVNANPTVFISGNLVICNGKTTTLTANGASTYTWSTAQTQTAITVSPSVNAVYTLTGSSSAGCTATTSIAVTSNSLPLIAIAQASSAVCPMTSTSFTASGANTYTWSGGSNSSTISVTPSVSSVYTVSGTNGAGCISASTVALSTYSLPIMSISPATSTVCSYSQASLTASGASTYSWNTGGTTAVISVTPASSTVYTVTGISSQGCIATQTAAVITNTLPVMSISPVSATTCAFSAVTFTAAGASSYQWSNGANTAATIISPSVSGVYTVTGTNPQGCMASTTVAISALPRPAVVITPSLTTLCLNANATFTASGALSYTWSNGAGTSSTAVLSSSLQATFYTVQGIGTNGCVGNGQVYILTNPLPTVVISASSPTVCSLAAVRFTASGASTYVWSNAATGSTVVINPGASSVYTVTGTDAVTGCSDSQTISVIAAALPNISISPASPTTCENSPVNLTAGGAVTYTWSNHIKQPGTTVTPGTTTVYSVSGTDALGCVNSTTVTVIVNALPVIVMTPSTQSICKNSPATFSASGAVSYTMNNSAGPVFSVSPIVTTVYVVSGTDANGCQNTSTVNVTVKLCTGIEELQAESRLTLFPNPSHGVFTASFGFEGQKTVLIFNSVGQVVRTRVTSQESEVFDISAMAKGVYFVRLSSTEASGNYKIVIE